MVLPDCGQLWYLLYLAAVVLISDDGFADDASPGYKDPSDLKLLANRKNLRLGDVEASTVPNRAADPAADVTARSDPTSHVSHLAPSMLCSLIKASLVAFSSISHRASQCSLYLYICCLPFLYARRHGALQSAYQWQHVAALAQMESSSATHSV